MRRVNHPLSTASFEAAADEVPESKALLMLNQRVADCFMLRAKAVGQAVCDAGLSGQDLQPLLSSLPAVPVFDPILGAHLAEVLFPLIKAIHGNEEEKG
jgi:hypothetical protein